MEIDQYKTIRFDARNVIEDIEARQKQGETSLTEGNALKQEIKERIKDLNPSTEEQIHIMEGVLAIGGSMDDVPTAIQEHIKPVIKRRKKGKGPDIVKFL